MDKLISKLIKGLNKIFANTLIRGTYVRNVQRFDEMRKKSSKLRNYSKVQMIRTDNRSYEDHFEGNKHF
jgi:hypothetical protein